jgi:hypothetical protein
MQRRVLTRSPVSSDPRADAGNRPCAHRFRLGRHRWRSASTARRSPPRALTTSSIVGSSLSKASNAGRACPLQSLGWSDMA